ncbi:MAG: CHASE3 domain-containing protein [Bacteroidia bacterium]|nr:CHASE3 domain-containing protein [Bacteroidota bacterium]MBP9081833.1 CHASE3 domain-containing protein [Bacteroidia bacterium]
MEYASILRRIFIVFGIALLITALLINLYRSSFEKLNENSSALVHSMNVLESIEELLSLMKDTEVGTRGYVITGDSAYLKPFLVAQNVLPLKIKELKLLTADNPVQQSYLDSIDNHIKQKNESQSFVVHLKTSGNLKFGSNAVMMESKLSMDAIRSLCYKMKIEESNLRKIRDDEVRDSIGLTKVISTIFSIAAISIMVIALVSILLELRSRKKIQESLKSVLEATQHGIMSFKAVRDPVNFEIIDFEFIQSNKGGSDLVSIPSDELLGKRLLSVFPGNIEEGLFDAYKLVTENDTVFKTEKYYKHETIDKWLRIVAVKLGDGFTVTFEDISTEKQYEIQLENTIQELKRSNNELEQFAFVASHDLQEPLRKIQSFGDRLKIKSQEELRAESILYVDKMLSAANRMSNLIFDLLSFSRLAKNNDAMHETDLNQVMNEVLTDLEVVIQQKNAEISFPPLPVINAISTQIYQLFFNLIGNALKFSKADETPKIEITVTPFSRSIQDKHTPKSMLKIPFIKIEISDNGIGLDNTYSERIFEIFQRLHGKSEYQGTGIGLAICKRIVTNHNGNIYASGIPGTGTTFTVELPLDSRLKLA